jgi:FkbM family methyltransferase
MLNNCRNVKIFNKAVGLKGRYRIASASKADEWYPREDNVAGTRLVEDTAGEFEVVSLDGFISPNNLRLIKTDCEGMDLEILQGAYKLIELFHPKIVFEFNGLVSKQPLEDYIKYLESFNYTVTRIGNWNWLAI